MSIFRISELVRVCTEYSVYLKRKVNIRLLLKVPGAGVRPYGGDVGMAEKGIITFEIGIHGIPVNMEPGVYTDLGASTLYQYFNYNLDNKDRYYYKRVYMGCVRANDFLMSLAAIRWNQSCSNRRKSGRCLVDYNGWAGFACEISGCVLSGIK